MALKYLYYVVVATEDGAKFVTKVDNATKTAYWDSNEKPMSFNKSYADDLALCLTLNFHLAFNGHNGSGHVAGAFQSASIGRPDFICCHHQAAQHRRGQLGVIDKKLFNT